MFKDGFKRSLMYTDVSNVKWYQKNVHCRQTFTSRKTLFFDRFQSLGIRSGQDKFAVYTFWQYIGKMFSNAAIFRQIWKDKSRCQK